MHYHLRILLFALCFYGFSTGCHSQTSDPLPALVTHAAFSNLSYTPPAKRRIMEVKHGLNPLPYVAAGMLFFYQRVVSEQIQANCSYQISCSEYTKRCIQQYGFVMGTLRGIHQLNNCAGGVYKDHCDYAVDPDYKIINHVTHE